MSTCILSPWPVRLHKRPLSDIDPESDFESKRLRQQSPSPVWAGNHLSEVPRSTSASPLPRSVGRALEDPNPVRAPVREHYHLQISSDSRVVAWLAEKSGQNPWPGDPPNNRPKSCPAILDNCISTPVSLATIRQMSQKQDGQNPGTGSAASQSGKPGTAHPLYRGLLYNNYISMDYSGRKMTKGLKEDADIQFLAQRKSPQLDDDSVSKIIDTAEELADSSEGPTSKLLRTPMFPIERHGIGEGGNAPWNTLALPNNHQYEYELSAPKPDLYLGYSTNQRSDWSYPQSNAIDHAMARPYTQPARGNTFPFFMVEMKSEAAGGTLYVAENQAAGSGSHSVNALLWLFKEAGQSHSTKDALAFTVTLSHREAIFYIHWYSADDQRFYMSFLESYSTVKPNDIRACNNTVKNIIDYGLGARKTTIGSALQALFPFPEHWKQSRPASTAPSTVDTLSTGSARPSKALRRK